MTKKCPLKQQPQSNPYFQLYDQYKPAQYRNQFLSGSHPSLPNLNSTKPGRDNRQQQQCPTSYADSIRNKPSDSSNSSSSSSKKTSVLTFSIFK